MSTPPNLPSASSIDPGETAPPRPVAPTDPMYWSIRRELWENRSLTIAPLAVAGFVLFVLLMTAFGLPRKVRNLAALEPARQHAVLVNSFRLAPSPIIVTTILVAIFFSLDALYGERRERSILFWKSLPVSDRTTVLSKAAFPLAVLPLGGFVLSIAVQAVLLLWSSFLLIVNGLDPAVLWGEMRMLEMPVILLYGIAAFTLWHAPIYGWLLLVSGWARRTPVLWAFLPPVAISVVERVAFGTSYIGTFYRHRAMGAMTAAFDIALPAKRGNFPVIDRLAQIDPEKFLRTPGLWIGLLFAAGCIAAAIRLRRYREPV